MSDSEKPNTFETKGPVPSGILANYFRCSGVSENIKGYNVFPVSFKASRRICKSGGGIWIEIRFSVAIMEKFKG